MRLLYRPCGLRYKRVFAGSNFSAVTAVGGGTAEGNAGEPPQQKGPQPRGGLLSTSCCRVGQTPNLGVCVLLCELQGTNPLFGALIQTP